MASGVWFSGAGRLGLCQLPDVREDAHVAGQPAPENPATDGPQGGHREADRMAHLPPHLQLTVAETGNDVKVVQELMRHAKLSTTIEVYTQAGMPRKRAPQRKAVDALFNRDSEAQRTMEQVGIPYCSHTAPTQSVALPDRAR